MNSTSARLLADTLGPLLLRSTRARLYQEITAGVHPAVDETTYPVISGIARGGPATAAQLAGQVGIDRSVVSRHADKLVNGGLLKRTPSPHDRRATQLHLTPQGEQVIATLRENLAAALATLLPDFSDEQTRELSTGLQHLVTALTTQAGRQG